MRPRVSCRRPASRRHPRPRDGRQARDLVKASGRLAKIDRIDAEVLTHFAEAIRAVARRMAEVVKASPAWKGRDELPHSIPGVGPVASPTLLAALPELEDMVVSCRRWPGWPHSPTTAGGDAASGMAAAAGRRRAGTRSCPGCGMISVEPLILDGSPAGPRHADGAGGGDDGAWSPDELADGHGMAGDSLEADDERQVLRRRLEELDERERAVVVLRFGLEGEAPLTLREVGERVGLTRESVRKLEARAIRKLGHSIPTAATSPARKFA